MTSAPPIVRPTVAENLVRILFGTLLITGCADMTALRPFSTNDDTVPSIEFTPLPLNASAATETPVSPNATGTVTGAQGVQTSVRAQESSAPSLAPMEISFQKAASIGVHSGSFNSALV